MKKPFAIAKPENPLPLVFDSPHSGKHYPDDFDYACSVEELRAAEDRYVDELYASAAKHGATLLSADFPRTYIDPNRSEDDIDLELLVGKKWVGSDVSPTHRSESGIGLVRRLIKPNVPLYRRSLSEQEVTQRIQLFYRPYHKALQELLDEAYKKHGQVWHINCHSMPSHTARPERPYAVIGNTVKPIDFCLGDQDGSTCSTDFRNTLYEFIRDMGYSVSINDPFKGVELIDKYSAPTRDRHSLQIEVNQSLYMDEETGEKNSNFDNLQADIEKIITFCTAYVQSELAIRGAERQASTAKAETASAAD